MLIALDFESYFDKEYSLKKMTTQEYILGDCFETIGAAIRVLQGPETLTAVGSVFVHGPQLEGLLGQIDWSTSTLLCHNTAFDGAILHWRYGHLAAFYLDTMSMAQALYAHRGESVSLEMLSGKVGRRKDTYALMNMMGVRYADIDWSTPEAQRYATYACGDVDICVDLFGLMMRQGFPQQELSTIDLVMRMYIDPHFTLDEAVLQEHLNDEIMEREAAVAATGYPESDLRSRARFATILGNYGYPSPTKISPRTGAPTYAFAKTDPGFRELLESPDRRLRTLCEGRLAAATSIEISRAERLLRIAATTPSKALAVPLKYSGAHTHRFSGLDKINLQNLGRESPLRNAVRARPGYKVVRADASQIEARILAWLAGEYGLCAQFGRGEDVYASFASRVFGMEVVKAQHPTERNVGKTGVLGLGYGCGAPKFGWMLSIKAGVDEPPEFARNVVKTYRETYPRIPKYWYAWDQNLRRMASGTARFEFGPFEVGTETIYLPNGLTLDYKGLTFSPYEEMTYEHPRYGAGHSIWGGAVTENVVQHLDHEVIVDTMVRMHKHYAPWHCALQIHDELLYVVPENEAQACLDALLFFLTRQPDWADSRLQLGAEGAIRDSYGGGE